MDLKHMVSGGFRAMAIGLMLAGFALTAGCSTRKDMAPAEQKCCAKGKCCATKPACKAACDKASAEQKACCPMKK